MSLAKYMEDNQNYFTENTRGMDTSLYGADINGVVYTTGKMSYASIDQAKKDVRNRRCIDGNVTGCGNCVGYCSFYDHPGYLTRRLRKEHNCIKKRCRYYLHREKSRNERENTMASSMRRVKYA